MSPLCVSTCPCQRNQKRASWGAAVGQGTLTLCDGGPSATVAVGSHPDHAQVMAVA